ncbi:MAG: metallophosphoesterase family protein [Verrucomicrobiota bacterium]|nr:metallophosphoesterase family protein [Verrucomicrobiota bacterium]
MKRVAHISDLHFGTEQPEVAGKLVVTLESLLPDLLVVSGDLTQRARPEQFQAAAEYLGKFDCPQLVVPGNHDVPLYDLFSRFGSPLKRYCQYISADLDPWWHQDDLAVLGLNTARSLTWKDGRISEEQIALIGSRFRSVPRDCFKLLVTHHPFVPQPGHEEDRDDLVGRAELAMPVIDEAGVDMLLAGHLHHGYSGDVRLYYPAMKRSIIVAQAGTAISNRIRNQANSFNLLLLDKQRIEIQVWLWDGTGVDEGFVKGQTIEYLLKGQEWRLSGNSV